MPSAKSSGSGIGEPLAERSSAGLKAIGENIAKRSRLEWRTHIEPIADRTTIARQIWGIGDQRMGMFVLRERREKRDEPERLLLRFCIEEIAVDRNSHESSPSAQIEPRQVTRQFQILT
jgi:hypothetical protein